MLQQFVNKYNVLLPQSVGKLEFLAKKFNAFFVKKIETVLVSIGLPNDLKLNDSHTTTLDTFHVFKLSHLKLLLAKFLNSTTLSDVIPTRLCKIVLTNSPDSFFAFYNLTVQTKYLPKSIQTRRRDGAPKEV